MTRARVHGVQGGAPNSGMVSRLSGLHARRNYGHSRRASLHGSAPRFAARCMMRFAEATVRSKTKALLMGELAYATAEHMPTMLGGQRCTEDA